MFSYPKMFFLSPDPPAGEADSTPASPGEGGASAAPATPAEGGAGVSSGEEASPDDGWNGEMESLAKQAWWNELGDETRTRLEAGLRTKHRSWQRGYQGKLGELSARERAWAEEKKALEAAAAAGRRRGDYFSDLLAADDQIGPLTEQLKGLEAALGEKDTKIKELEGRLTEADAKVSEASTAQELARHERLFPDIFADFEEDKDYAEGKKAQPEPTGAYVDFVRLRRAGYSEERAAEIVRADMARRSPPGRTVEDPPRSVETMSNGGGPRPSVATRRVTDSYDEVMRRKREEAILEEE